MGEVCRGIKLALGQHSATRHANSNDGMDALFCWFDHARQELTSAHAQMPLFVLQPGQKHIQFIQGDRIGLVYPDTPHGRVWATHSNQLARGAVLTSYTTDLVDRKIVG